MDIAENDCGVLDVQLRFTDIDMFGHVNNNSYLQYMDLGKSRYITDVLSDTFDVHGAALVIVNLNCQFLAVTRYEEPVRVLTRVEAMGQHSVTFFQKVLNPETLQEKCECRTVMAAYDVRTGQGITVPDEWRRRFSRKENRKL